MLRSLHSDDILRREIGFSFGDGKFSSAPKYTLTKSFPTSFQGSTAIWVGSRENLIFTLDSRGRVVMYNTLSNNEATTLINSPSHAFKCILSKDTLITISKTQDSPYLSISSYPITSLQSGILSNTQILPHLNLTLSDIHEINDQNLLISITNSSTFQVWSLQSSSLQISFPFNPQLSFQYTDSSLVFWQRESNQTSIGILQNNKLKTLALNSTNDIYLCEIINNTLVICMKSCHIQIIDLTDYSVEIIKKGVPLQVFRLNSQNAVLAVFNDGTANFIGKQNVEFRIEGKNFVCGENEDMVVLASDCGRVYVNCEKIDLMLFGKKMCQLGANPDTRQIIFTEKGKISVFE